MTSRPILWLIVAAWLIAIVTAAPVPAFAAAPGCEATARRAPADPRISAAVREAVRQHRLFGGQTIERNGGLFRLGFHEAEWGRAAGEAASSWQLVATFWKALSESDPPALMSSVGRVERADATGAAGTGVSAPSTVVAIREALLRAAIVDTPWSAAFISYLMKTSGLSGDEFEFSERHADYVQAALDASAAEAAGQEVTHAFRACDVATTRPRAGDVLCATRATAAGTVRFDALAVAMKARAASQGFPMHCDLVVRADEGGDAKLETIGGNVANSVTLSRMTLNAKKLLSDTYITGAASLGHCAESNRPCSNHLSRRPWLVLLQFRR